MDHGKTLLCIGKRFNLKCFFFHRPNAFLCAEFVSIEKL